jgi:NAD+ diphosphatase
MMKDLFDHPFPEPSAATGFSGNRIVRDAEKRNGQSLQAALLDPASRFHVFSGARAIVRKDERPGATLSRIEVLALEPDFEAAILLGTDAAGPRIAVPSRLSGEPAEPFKPYDFRSLLYSSAVSDEEAGAIAQAGSLLQWHSSNRHCGKCGAPTVATNGGYRRDCAACGTNVFPRTDPVVIMLAVRGDRCLLGRSPHFPPGWFSTLAGFVEPGETIEDAVRRETLEESGIRIGRVRYHASQPWPFPHSLMIGCHCEALDDEIRHDQDELEDCRWFSRDEVRQMLAGSHPGELKCPPNKAVASLLIRAWAEG